jgi:hypothetical protein
MITGSILFLATDGVHLIDTITSTLRFTEKRQSGLSQFVSVDAGKASCVSLTFSSGRRRMPASQQDRLPDGEPFWAPGTQRMVSAQSLELISVATFLTSFLQFDPDARMTAEQASTWLKHLKSVGERVQSTPE